MLHPYRESRPPEIERGMRRRRVGDLIVYLVVIFKQKLEFLLNQKTATSKLRTIFR